MEASREHGFPCWRDQSGDVRVCFVGRGPRLDVAGLVRRLVSEEVRSSWASQIHSAEVLNAVPGCAGQGDALFTASPGLVLTVATADCVPVLLASSGKIAAVHAGWRGAVGGVVEAALAHFAEPANEITAWMGPSIGPCCYEVGAAVGAAVRASVPDKTASGLLRPGREGASSPRLARGCRRPAPGAWSWRDPARRTVYTMRV